MTRQQIIAAVAFFAFPTVGLPADPIGSLDGGGCRTTSASVAMDGSIGAIGGLSTAASPPEALKSGFIGQLYDPLSLSIGASPTNLNEGTTRQLTAAQTLDDGTILAMASASVSWTVVSGPISSISADGLATAGWVYRHTPASVGGSEGGFSASLGLLVGNVTSDDFGLYAEDGIDDDWQVLYFGEDNPEAGPGRDPDRDGRDNLFESMALTIPTDAASFFQLRARSTPSHPGSVDLIFGPIRVERTYTVLHSPDLSPASWGVLTGTTQSEDGDERTVTDPDAGTVKKFYRVHIER